MAKKENLCASAPLRDKNKLDFCSVCGKSHCKCVALPDPPPVDHIADVGKKVCEEVVLTDLQAGGIHTEPEFKKHMMIDIETMSKKHNALIVSVGLVVFSMNGEKRFKYFELDWTEQILKHRHICPQTINWWNEKTLLIPNGKDLVEEMFLEIAKIAKEKEVSKFWFRGPQFDAVKLESLADDFGCKVPWNYKQVCDCRTFDLFRDPDMEVVEAPHIAVEDARKQARELVHTLKYMGEVI